MEAWHLSLKKTAGNVKRRRQFSLKGCCEHIHERALFYDARAEKAAKDFRYHGESHTTYYGVLADCQNSTKHLAELHDFPQILKFPWPIQQMLATRLRIAEQRIADEEETRELTDDLSCDCLFNRRYLLPCEHVFQYELLYHVLTEEHWDRFAHMFEESGFDIYEASEELEVNRELAAEVTAPAHRKLRVREITESIKESYYALEEEIKKFDLESDEMGRAMDYWITGLSNVTGDLMRQSVRDLVQNIPRLKRRVDTIVINAERAEAAEEDDNRQEEESKDESGSGSETEPDNSSDSEVAIKQEGGEHTDHPMILDP